MSVGIFDGFMNSICERVVFDSGDRILFVKLSKSFGTGAFVSLLDCQVPA